MIIRFDIYLLLAAGILALPATADETQDLLERAMADHRVYSYISDNSAAERRLQAILEQAPEHLEARWQLIYAQLAPLRNRGMWRRGPGLAAVGEDVRELVDLAIRKGERAFAHYVTAVHASVYRDYPRAHAEIDQALAMQPDSVRYRLTKGRLLHEQGNWERDNELILSGTERLKEARRLYAERPTILLDAGHIEFQTAYAYAELPDKHLPKVIEHYRAALDETPANTVRAAFAWTNVSIAYRRTSQCQEALDAAQKALDAIGEFGSARRHRQSAEFCLAMQRMGFLDAKTSAEQADASATSHSQPH